MRHEKRFTIDKLKTRMRLLEPLVYREKQALDPFKYHLHNSAEQPGKVGIDIDDSNWPCIDPDTYWGKWYSNFTLRSSFSVPDKWQNNTVALLFNIGHAPSWDFCHPEALVYIDACAVAGIDQYHRSIYVPAEFKDNNRHLLALDGYTGRWGYYDKIPELKFFMEQCYIALVDTELRDFLACARVALESVCCMDKNSTAHDRILNALDSSFNCLDLREPMADDFYASVPKAHKVLSDNLALAGDALDVNISAIGHTHIDVAWVWPLVHTRKKCARSFNTVLALMDESEDYIFTQSQPQLYDFVRQDYPELFEKIKQKVKQGRWEAVGGMWVEADCNITGPESLVRQFVLGRGFFAEHFGPGTESPVLWLPDVFGYAFNLPQIMKLAGIEYFFTTKLSWNRYNQMPYDTFMWQGLDGTRVLTHLGTTTSNDRVTYNGMATPEEFLNTWTNCKQKHCHKELMTCFGHGDGGGGPTRMMLENIRETRNFPGMPRVSHQKAIDFFRRLEKDCSENLPTWNGELYLEGHRGTYTTQARNKKANRQSEFNLHDTEYLACMAAMLDKSYKYPHEQFTQAWKLVCLNQFHDIIPGSSIAEVYKDSLQQYDQIKSITDQIKTASLNVLAGHINANILVANCTSFLRRDLALYQGSIGPDKRLADSDGKTLLTQEVHQGTLIDIGPMQGYSIKSLTVCPAEPEQNISDPLIVSDTLLENKYLRVLFNEQGDIISIYDKINKRQVLTENAIGNQMQAFEDRPIDWDAWDIDIFYDEKMWLSEPADSVSVLEDGPLRAVIAVKRRILNSIYTQYISMTHNSPVLEFRTEIDWQEKHVLLKAAFPVNIHAAFATYEIQWGSLQRPIHHNTSWDWARFEGCAQKWVDLSEGNYGVSLLNKCKYGHDIKDNTMRITLLRSPTMPDPDADQGKHSFTYALFAHSNSLDMETIKNAYILNDPLLVHLSECTARSSKDLSSFVSVNCDNAVIETVKQAQDGNGIIVRLYEANRCRGPVILSTGFDLQDCYITDLLENNQQHLDVKKNQVCFDIRPFEIITLRLMGV